MVAAVIAAMTWGDALTVFVVVIGFTVYALVRGVLTLRTAFRRRVLAPAARPTIEVQLVGGPADGQELKIAAGVQRVRIPLAVGELRLMTPEDFAVPECPLFEEAEYRRTEHFSRSGRRRYTFVPTAPR